VLILIMIIRGPVFDYLIFSAVQAGV
jgi:hypothetical protein